MQKEDLHKIQTDKRLDRGVTSQHSLLRPQSSIYQQHVQYGTSQHAVISDDDSPNNSKLSGSKIPGSMNHQLFARQHNSHCPPYFTSLLPDPSVLHSFYKYLSYQISSQEAQSCPSQTGSSWRLWKEHLSQINTCPGDRALVTA